MIKNHSARLVAAGLAVSAAGLLAGPVNPADAASLKVSPKNKQTLMRDENGDYSPGKLKYTLSSSGKKKVKWRLRKHPGWLVPNKASGKAGKNGFVNKFAPNAKKIDKFEPGTYTSKLRYKDRTGGGTIKRNVVLVVEGSTDAGEAVFEARCQACHKKTADHAVGPGLEGVYGRTAGTVEGYNFSTAMENYGEIWEEDTLDAFIEDPDGVVPGTKMAFSGLADAQDRMDLIAFLKSLTP